MDYSFFAAAPPAPAHQPYPFFIQQEKPTHTYTPPAEVQQDPLAFDDLSAYQFLDQNHHNPTFDTSTFIPASHSPAQSINPPHHVPQPPPVDRQDSLGNEPSMETDFGNQNPERSSDDDKESLTPAQSRRKAQNRAAQRAFRERKEKHVKELEVKLKSIEAQSTNLMSDNERLRKELNKLKARNEVLRVKREYSERQSAAPSTEELERAMETGPQAYSPTTFGAAFSDHLVGAEPKPHMITYSETGERVYGTGATWDFIHAHPLSKRKGIEMAQIVDRLREHVRCNGYGPSFAESEILKAIEECQSVPGDELI